MTPLNWIDVNPLPFNALLLLEQVQLSWFPGWVPEAELAVALRANPAVEWFMRHKCPAIQPWLDQVLSAPATSPPPGAAQVRQAELAVMTTINDLLVYAIAPAIYDALPFLGWDERELTGLVDFAGKTVIDIGSGTGRQALIAARAGAHAVFAVEPVANLRLYIQQKARAAGLRNIFPVDGLITDLPFPGGFADVVMSGHVFGDQPAAECAEMARVARPGGMVILIPGNNDIDNPAHAELVAQGYAWSRFEEPTDGIKRKYWKVIH